MKFWEGLGSGLADRFLGRLFTPALLFWTTGTAAWLFANTRPGGGRQLLPLLRSAAGGLDALSATAQIALLAGVAALLVASALAAEQLTLPLLRVLEGYYWPPWLARRLRRRAASRRRRMLERWTALVKRAGQEALTPELAVELSDVEQALRRTPSSAELIMPTRLGNILRAAEERPSTRYGLDVAVCWPMLWMLLERDTRDEVSRARTALNGSVTLLLWAVLSLVWTPLAWWVLPLAACAVSAIYYVPVLSSAQVYGDLMSAVFDLRRTRLYEALRWPLPDAPGQEPAAGRALTAYLWRGIAPASSRFRPGPPPPPAAAQVRAPGNGDHAPE